MSPRAFRDAIFAQPENLAAGAQAVRERLAASDLSAWRRGTLVLSGIGASAHALIPAVAALRAGGRRAFAVDATQCTPGLGDAYVLVSQSGASAETVQALARLDGAPALVVSAHEDSPLGRAAHLWLPLGPRPDTPVATLSYTATLQTLGMLCDALLECDSGWATLPDVAAGVLDSVEPRTDTLSERFAGVRALDAAGSGGAAASAGETALLGREGLRLPATGMETRTYLHGPLEAVAPGFGAIVFGAGREQDLAQALMSYGAEVALVSDAGGEGEHVIALPEAAPLVAPILQILPVQLLVDHVAARRGLTIGDLTRHQDDTKVTA